MIPNNVLVRAYLYTLARDMRRADLDNLAPSASVIRAMFVGATDVCRLLDLTVEYRLADDGSIVPESITVE